MRNVKKQTFVPKAAPLVARGNPDDTTVIVALVVEASGKGKDGELEHLQVLTGKTLGNDKCFSGFSCLITRW